MIGQPKRLTAAVTMSECTIMRVGKREIQRLLQEESAFSQMFVSHILARKDRVEEDLVDQLFNSTEKRLARLLLLLANFGKEGSAGANCRKYQPGSTRRDDRNNSIARESLHEQVSRTRVHRLQRPSRSAQLAPECGFERGGAHRSADSVRSGQHTPRYVGGNPTKSPGNKIGILKWVMSSLRPAGIVKRQVFSTATSVGNAMERDIA